MLPDPGTLQKLLRRLPAADSIKTWWLAYSGGVDSQVLLHLLAELPLNVQAIYVDHGLHPDSSKWAEHCRRSCRQLGVPFQVLTVDARAYSGEGPEAAARKARYTALADKISADDCLLTAQHLDDQAETFLLQLLRGAGAAGLAGMPFYCRFAGAWHMRPLLGYSREDILAYANSHNLSWVEDPSNRSDRYDRNFLRHRIIPALRQRWPAIDCTLAKAARQQAENMDLLERLAEIDFDQAADAGNPVVSKLLNLDETRQRNLLRYWINRRGHPLPSRRVLWQILQQMLMSREDADPRVNWADSEMRRYRDRLYLINVTAHDPAGVYSWQADQPLVLESLGQKLELVKSDTGLRNDILSRRLNVRFRQGGERIRPVGREGHHRLKKLFQEQAVPPWMRDRIPLLFLEDELIAVIGYWIAEDYASIGGAPAYQPVLKLL